MVGRMVRGVRTFWFRALMFLLLLFLRQLLLLKKTISVASLGPG